MRCRGVHFIALMFISGSSMAACPPPELASQWPSLTAHQFDALNRAEVQVAAIALLPCLSHPDPAIRDALAIDALTTWLRGKRISTSTAGTMLSNLRDELHAEDADGFGRPFAALALAEVARMDRIDSYLTPEQWTTLVDEGAQFLKSVRDYRGFDEREGWRHGVAHGADLLMQLALNPRANKRDLDAILDAVAVQVAPPSAHIYVYGESERLARPVVFALSHRLHSTEAWAQWLQRIAAPAPFESWPAAFKTHAGWAKRHDTRAFLNALFVRLQLDTDEATHEAYLEQLVQTIGSMP